MSTTTVLPFQPDAMTSTHLAAVSYLDPLVGIQRAHVELFIRHLGESGLMPSSVNTMMGGGKDEEQDEAGNDAENAASQCLATVGGGPPVHTSEPDQSEDDGQQCRRSGDELAHDRNEGAQDGDNAQYEGGTSRSVTRRGRRRILLCGSAGAVHHVILRTPAPLLLTARPGPGRTADRACVLFDD